MTEIRTTPGGTVKWSRDATANDSDKIVLTVPTGKLVRLIDVAGTIVNTATVGNRTLRVDIGNGTNVIWYSQISANITASQRGSIRIRFSGAAMTVYTSAQYGLDGNYENINISQTGPEMWLPAGYTVRIWDTAAIDAAADDLTTVIEYIEYDA